MVLLPLSSSRNKPPGRLLLHGLEHPEHGHAEQQRPRAWLGLRLAAAPPQGGERAAVSHASSAPSPSAGSSSEPGSGAGGSSGQAGPAAPPSSNGSQGGGTPSGGGGGGEPAGSSGEPAGSAGPLGGLVAALQDAGRLVGDPAFAGVPVPTIFLGGLPAPIPAGEWVGCAAMD